MVLFQLKDVTMHLVIFLFKHSKLYIFAVSDSLAFLLLPRCSLAIFRSA